MPALAVGMSRLAAARAKRRVSRPSPGVSRDRSRGRLTGVSRSGAPSERWLTGWGAGRGQCQCCRWSSAVFAASRSAEPGPTQVTPPALKGRGGHRQASSSTIGIGGALLAAGAIGLGAEGRATCRSCLGYFALSQGRHPVSPGNPVPLPPSVRPAWFPRSRRCQLRSDPLARLASRSRPAPSPSPATDGRRATRSRDQAITRHPDSLVSV